MQEQHLYEYSIIRVIPQIEREEFMNIGIILFSKRQNYIKVKYYINEKRIKDFFFHLNLDIKLFLSTLEVIDKISQGEKEAGKIAQLKVPERFRWLTATRSTIIQTTKPHPGFSTNLDKTLERLFKELVI